MVMLHHIANHSNPALPKHQILPGRSPQTPPGRERIQLPDQQLRLQEIHEDHKTPQPHVLRDHIRLDPLFRLLNRSPCLWLLSPICWFVWYSGHGQVLLLFPECCLFIIADCIAFSDYGHFEIDYCAIHDQVYFFKE